LETLFAAGLNHLGWTNPIKTALVDPWKSAAARAVGILLNLLSNFTQSTE
jgi:hypothetical protein